MKHSSKIAFLSIFASVLIVGTASAAYIASNYPMPSKADGVSTSSAAQIPNDLAIQEALHINDTVQIVSAYSNLDDYAHTNLSLWRIDSSKNTVEKIHEFKSGVPAGLTTSISRNFLSKEYVFTIDESWEGYRIVERVNINSKGQVTSVVRQPGTLEFSVESQGHTITVKPAGTICHGDASTAENTSSTITHLSVNNESWPLKNPYTLVCGYMEMQNTQIGEMFRDFNFGEPHFDGTRHAYINLFNSTNTLELILDTDGKVRIEN